MNILQKIHGYLFTLDTKDFYKNVLIFLGGNLLACCLIGYLFLTTMSTLSDSLQDAYKKEEETKQLLDRLTKVKKQSEEKNSILEQDQTFRIKNFYDDTIKKFNLDSKQRREADVSEEEVLKGRYTEVRLTSFLNGIDTRQLCDLLQALEQKSRIYMKELTITKKDSLVDVNIIIATLTSEVDGKKAV